MNETMVTPHSIESAKAPSRDAWRVLRTELDALADALVDASPGDRLKLRARVRHAVEACRRCERAHDDLARLLQHILADLSGDGAPLDTLYYARQVAVQADRLPN